jgi:16S rRNA (cytidine1402-2'-O)-methyltransferase
MVTVPIGNLEDITLRAKRTLEEAKTIICEDTRKSKSLLNALGIELENKEFISFHDHSSEGRSNQIVNRLKTGENCVLVSEAGSPVISDPAYGIIKKIVDDEKIEIETVPGVSAVITGLELSGLAPIPFYFYGFLPREKAAVRNAFTEKLQLKGTHIFFESPERLRSTLLSLKEFKNLRISVAREMTKKFESIYKFNSETIDQILDSIEYRGEIVLLVENSQSTTKGFFSDELIEMVRKYTDGDRGVKQLSKIFSEILNQSSKEIYLKLQK